MNKKYIYTDIDGKEFDIRDNTIYQYIQEQLKIRKKRIKDHPYLPPRETNIIGVLPIRQSGASTVAKAILDDGDVYVGHNNTSNQYILSDIKNIISLTLYDIKTNEINDINKSISLVKKLMQEINKIENIIQNNIELNLDNTEYEKLKVDKQRDIENILNNISLPPKYDKIRGRKINKVVIDLGSYGYMHHSYKITKFIDFVLVSHPGCVVIVL